jgi:hypothetical protein
MSRIRIVRSDVDREEAVKPLVNAFKVPRLSGACRILFVNGDSLSLSTEFSQIGLVLLQGSAHGNPQGGDLLVAESQGQLITILQHALPQFLQKFTEPIVSASLGIASIQDEKLRESIFTAKIVETVKTQQESQEFLKMLTRHIGGAIKPLAEMLVGSLYKFYLDRQRNQRQVISEFDDVVNLLTRLGLLSPFLTLAICPACNNYESVFSRFTRFSPGCPKCGSRWPVLTVSEFPESFSNLKKMNHDLPVFISAYLKSKSPLPVNVLPNAEVELESGKAEIDVLILDTATGIECKCYTNNVAVSESTIHSEAGKIKQQIDRYVALGLTRVVVITNYNDADTEKLRTRLKEELKQVKGLSEWKLLGSDLAAFARLLDEESKRISDAQTARMQTEFEQRIAKQMAQADEKKEL